MPQPAEAAPERPVRPPTRRVEPPTPPQEDEPPITGEAREEKPEVDPETGEVIPPHVGQAAFAPIQ